MSDRFIGTHVAADAVALATVREHWRAVLAMVHVIRDIERAQRLADAVAAVRKRRLVWHRVADAEQRLVPVLATDAIEDRQHLVQRIPLAAELEPVLAQQPRVDLGECSSMGLDHRGGRDGTSRM